VTVMIKGIERQGQDRVRADLHVLPAAHLRALPQPVLCVAPAPRARCTSAARTASCWSTRTAAAAGACACQRLPVQEGLLQPQDRQGREVHLVLPAHRGRHAHRVLGDLRRPAALHRPGPLRRRQGPRGRGDRERARPLRRPAGLLPRSERPRGPARRPRRRHPRRLDRGRAQVPGVQVDQQVQGGAAAASGVPHDADGLVHPAAVTGGRRAQGDRQRRRGPRQPVRRARRAADPGRVPRGPVHRR
jgi:hypothetical protein